MVATGRLVELVDNTVVETCALRVASFDVVSAGSVVIATELRAGAIVDENR